MVLPVGTVTFLFTDLEGSTRLWEELPDAMRESLLTHDEILRSAIESHGGVVYSEMGDGMAAVFVSPTKAVEAAIAAQLRLAEWNDWGETGPLRARMGLHAGEGVLKRDGHYVNQPLNRCARLMALAHGGQVVVSGSVETLVRGALPAEVTLVGLGEHRLRDLTQALEVFQVAHPGLPTDFPPLRSLNVLPGNLPRQVSTFVGRETELASLAELLQETSLVTITGVGGVGKTRLALQVAADIAADFPDGAWLCQLAAVSDPAAVRETLAASLGVQAFQGRTLEESVLEFLTAKRLVLVLDNCEHLLDAAAALAEDILQRCPDVALLATSREGLAVAGERMVALRSLGVPADDHDVDAVLAADAVQLFSDRATAAKDDFVLSERNASAVGVLCRRLDGIPLAIELAAARVRSLSPEDLVARLDQRFKLLTGGSRGALERQQTLRSTIDWSYDLLEPAERQALDHLSVFAGGCDLRAAEAVLASSELEELDVVDALGHLVDKSLVIVDAEDGASVRYRLLESIRQYARERLEASGDTARVRRRHADYYVELAESAAPHLRSREQMEWAGAMARETDNFRVVLDWAIENAAPAHAYRMIAPFTVQGLPIAYTAMEWADHAIHIPGGEEDPLFVPVAAWAAWGATMGGDLDRGAALVELAERAHHGAGEPDALLLRSRAIVSYFRGDGAQATRDAEAWVAQARASTDHHQLDAALVMLGAARAGGWNPLPRRDSATEEVLEVFDEAVRTARAAGLPASLPMTLCAVAGYVSSNDSERALEMLDEAIELGTASGDHMAVTIAISHKGALAARSGDWRTALGSAAHAAQQQLELGDLVGVVGSLVVAAAALDVFGRVEVAKQLLGQAYAMSPSDLAFGHYLQLAAASVTDLMSERSGDDYTELMSVVLQKGPGAESDLPAAVARLRAEAASVLAEPVDPSTGPATGSPT